MRLSYVLLFAAAGLAGVLDTTSAAAGVVVAKPNTANAVNLRFLRLQKYVEEDDDDDEDEDEERMWNGFTGALSKAKQAVEDKAAVMSVAANFYGKNADEMGDVVSKLSPSQIDTIFDKGEDAVQNILPGFSTKMGYEKFDKLVKGLPSEQQAVMISAYSKYLDMRGLL